MLDHLNLTQFEALALWGVLLVAIAVATVWRGWGTV